MKVFRYLNRMLDGILEACFLILFLLGIYGLVDTHDIYEHASDPSLQQYHPEEKEPVRTQAVHEKLAGSIGWLQIEGTEIDYPLMQGKDNQEYLNHDPYGEFSISGSIFLDYRNNPDFSDVCNVIYGHHMAHEKMFGQLDDFLDPAFFSDRAKGILYVGDEEYEIIFTGCFQTTADDPVVYDVRNPSVSSLMAKLEESAPVKKITGKENHLVMMSTCRDTVSDVRTVLVGNLKKKNRQEELP